MPDFSKCSGPTPEQIRQVKRDIEDRDNKRGYRCPHGAESPCYLCRPAVIVPKRD